MILGKGYAKIQLCDADGIEQHSYTFTGPEQSDIKRVTHPEDLDTEGIEIMDNGDRKKIIAGKNIQITIPVQVAENISPAGWETFLYQLWDWESTGGKIKVTPYNDESGYTFWCILKKGRTPDRMARNLLEIDVLEFIGAERLSSVS